MQILKISVISKEKHQSGHLGEMRTLQDAFIHILSFGIVSILNYVWGRRNTLSFFGT